MDNHIEKYAEHNASQLEKIADEHAIEFAIFIQDYNYHSTHNVWVDSYSFLGNKFTSQELIEKFKQEKEL